MVYYRLSSFIFLIPFSFSLIKGLSDKSLLSPENILRLARSLPQQVDIQENLEHASRNYWDRISRSQNSLSRLEKLVDRKISEITSKMKSTLTSSITRQLPNPVIEIYRDVLPSLMKHSGNMGGMLLKSINSMVENPDRLQRVAEKISNYVTGSEIEEDSKYSKHALEMIHDAGFLGSEHRVVTPDGYILTMHRIVSPNPRYSGDQGQRQVVFLQHGVLCSSDVWLIGDRSKALGFLLADAGFDVWLGNFRGNTYSRNHTFLDPEQAEFWQFSWDQMGFYDLPTMLQYIRYVTGTGDPRTGEAGIVYIGHSMGTTTFWVMCNEFPELASSLVSLMVGLAPVSVVSRMTSPVKYIAPISNQIERMISMTGNSEFGTKGGLVKILSLCDSFTVVKNLREELSQNNSMCSIPMNIWSLTTGFDHAQTNYTLIPEIFGHAPAGTSAKTMAHFAQGINSKRFSRFDYEDPLVNMQVYGNTSPPDYDLSMVQVPVLLYWGQNDWLASPEDVMNLGSQLPMLIDSIRVPYDDWNHMDFMWAKDADTLLYKPMIEYIQNFVAF